MLQLRFDLKSSPGYFKGVLRLLKPAAVLGNACGAVFNCARYGGRANESAVVVTVRTPDGFRSLRTDPVVATVCMTYDLKGRKTGMNDPDMGAWTYVYD